ncbi:MAG: sulfotransferase [Cyclobacteriaceae bacterium]|nr:sulfotransferase [Cyclobacteriaceae bacterium]
MSETNIKGDGYPVNPFFLIGCVRSGTTLLRLLLGHHPSICKCEEFDFSVDFFEDNQSPPTLSDFHYYLKNHRGFKLSRYKIDKTLCYHELLNSFLRQRQIEDARPVVGATVHSNFHKLVEIWPDAKFIYLRRDPRNVSRSIIKQGWAGTTWHGTLPWNKAETSWKDLKKMISSKQCKEIRYEDLIVDTIGTLEVILSHIDLNFNPEMLEIEKDTTYNRPNSNEAQHWSKSATPEEIQLVEVCADELLLNAGYEHSQLPILHISSLKKLQLNMRNRYNKIRFFINKYGLLLWLLSITSRRLPFDDLRTDIQLRIDEVTNKHMK